MCCSFLSVGRCRSTIGRRSREQAVGGVHKVWNAKLSAGIVLHLYISNLLHFILLKLIKNRCQGQ